ncbi:unnamed protein product [Pedinophyceae sp. YPF-701]|nr:unnamed protein product [Pedinophyceae sp. YPF-701]
MWRATLSRLALVVWVALAVVARAWAARAGISKEHDGEDGAAEEGGQGFVNAFARSFMMILVSEAGDETFIIAAIMAMRHKKTVIFAGAMAALAAMTIISTALGVVIPNLISKKTTTRLATLLYLGFGLRLYWIAYNADPHGTEEEIEEVEGKLKAGSAGRPGPVQAVRKWLTQYVTVVFVECCILTFLAEWGDRSQIATITLASHMDPIGVTIGAILGHCICTGAACLGGELLAKRISQRTVAVTGGSLFLLFALGNAVSK